MKWHASGDGTVVEQPPKHLSVEAGNTKGTIDNFCFYLQNRLIQTSQIGGQWYTDTSPFSIPWLEC